VRDPDLGNHRADVFHWGFFAYFLLSRGKYPYLDPGILVPLAEHAPQVPHYLRVAVEAALCWRPQDRPEHGPAIQKVLMVGGFGVIGAPPPGASPTPEEPVEAPPEKLQASQVFQAFLADADELHMSLGPSTGRITAVPEEETVATEEPCEPAAEDTPEPPEGEGAEARSADADDEGPVAEAGPLEEVPPPPEGDQDLSLGVYQSGSGMRAMVVPGEAPPAVTEEEPSTGFGAELQHLEESAEAGGAPVVAPAPAARWPVGVAGLVLGLAGGWLARGHLEPPLPPAVVRPMAPATSRPASPSPEAEAPRESTSGEAILALAPSKAAPFHADDQVVRLLRMQELTPEAFPETWKLLRDLVTQKRLPPVMLDSTRLVAMRRTFAKDKGAGVGELRRWLEDLRTVLGPPQERQP
jgi:hypothetical protein